MIRLRIIAYSCLLLLLRSRHSPRNPILRVLAPPATTYRDAPSVNIATPDVKPVGEFEPSKLPIIPTSTGYRTEHTIYRASQIFAIAGFVDDVQSTVRYPLVRERNWAVTKFGLNSNATAAIVRVDFIEDSTSFYTAHRFQKRGGKIGMGGAIILNIVKASLRFREVHRARSFLRQSQPPY